MFDCIILAGGLGTRLKETVPDLPKPLAPIRGRPFLDILLSQLQPLPLKKIILAIGYKAEHIQAYYKDTVQFSIEEQPLGTAGALFQALKKTTTPYVLVLNGDSYLEFSFPDMQKPGADLVIACIERENGSRFGQIAVDQEGRIRAFTEKSSCTSGLVNGGIYWMRRDLLQDFPHAFSLEKEVFPAILDRQVFASICRGKFIDIGTKESFFEAQKIL